MDVSLDDERRGTRRGSTSGDAFHRHIADAGFATSSRRVEVWSEPFASNGLNPCPLIRSPP